MISRAIKSLIPDVPVKLHFRRGQERADFAQIEWPKGFTPPTWEEVSARAAEMEAEATTRRAADLAESERLAYLDDLPAAVDAIMEYLDQQEQAGITLPSRLSEMISRRSSSSSQRDI